MLHNKKYLLLVLLLFCFVIQPVANISAAENGIILGDPSASVKAVGADFGTAETDLPTLIGRIINIFLSLLGIIFVILIIYGGYLYMTASGDPNKAKKGADVFKTAVIGLVIIFLAYAITTFVIDQLTTSSTAPVE